MRAEGREARRQSHHPYARNGAGTGQKSARRPAKKGEGNTAAAPPYRHQPETEKGHRRQNAKGRKSAGGSLNVAQCAKCRAQTEKEKKKIHNDSLGYVPHMLRHRQPAAQTDRQRATPLCQSTKKALYTQALAASRHRIRRRRDTGFCLSEVYAMCQPARARRIFYPAGAGQNQRMQGCPLTRPHSERGTLCRQHTRLGKPPPG